jgi:hypothetical protein
LGVVGRCAIVRLAIFDSMHDSSSYVNWSSERD